MPEPAGGTPTLPGKCRLTFQRGDSVDSPWDHYELPHINTSLSLGTAVRTAYGMPAKADPLAFLLALNLTLATKEKAGESSTPPGFPFPEAERAAFITADCIEVTEPEAA